MATFAFDASTVAPQDTFTPVPAGQYIAEVIESSVSPTKSGTGMMMKLTWTILDGQFKGRRIFDRINVANQNPEAEQIGQRQLSAICHATGVMKLQDTSQLHGKPCSIAVKIRKDEQYGDSNEVKGYSAATGGAAPGIPSFAQPGAQQPAAQAPASPSAAPPWAQRPAA